MKFSTREGCYSFDKECSPKLFSQFNLIIETQEEANMVAEMFKACTQETDIFFGVPTKVVSMFLDSRSSVNMVEGCLKPLEINV